MLAFGVAVAYFCYMVPAAAAPIQIILALHRLDLTIDIIRQRERPNIPILQFMYELNNITLLVK